MFISSYQQLLGINRFQQPSSISVIFTSIDVPQTTGWCCRRPGAYSDQKRDSVLSCLTISLGNPQPDKLPVTLSGMEVSLVNAMSRETILRQYLDTVKRDYTHILIDCQPSLDMLKVNADRVLIPVQAEQLLESTKKGQKGVRTFSWTKL